MFITYTKVNNGRKSTIIKLGQVEILQGIFRPKAHI